MNLVCCLDLRTGEGEKGRSRENRVGKNIEKGVTVRGRRVLGAPLSEGRKGRADTDQLKG